MRNKKAFIILSCVMCLFVLLVCWPGLFTKGYICNMVDYESILDEDFLDYVTLNEQGYEMEFMPVSEYFCGFEINLVDVSKDSAGEIYLDIYENDEKIDRILVDIGNLSNREYYKVYCDVSLKKNKVYRLNISAKNYNVPPKLQLIDEGYLPQESVSGNLLIGYSYKETTFTLQDKVLFCMYAFALWLFFLSKQLNKNCKVVSKVAVFLFLIAILTWNYTFNTMGYKNKNFEDFSHGSETLVTSVIEAENNNIGISKYGLGRYENSLGEFRDYDIQFISNDNWTEGYSNDKTAIVVASTKYTKNVAKVGNYVEFANDVCLKISKIKDNGDTIKIYFDSDETIKKAKYGDLSDAIFLDKNKNALPTGRLEKYVSQYGLQGKIFRHMARFINEEDVISCLNLLCSIATATVFTCIVMLLAKKYNVLLAGCFFVTFWLSPWIVNFASNLYWVEFTWFIPMAIGLFYSISKENKKCRLLCYFATFFAVLIKCLCGYEYISVIMMGLIAFLLVDFVHAITDKDKKEVKSLFKAIFTLGIMALLGFLVAILMHAQLRGNGNVLQGAKDIFEQDVLRRTSGADMNSFEEELWPSFNASVWEVLCRYFHFSTEIISGIDGSLFPVLCVIPLGIFVFEYKNNEIDKKKIIMYIVFFLSCISWFVLAKSHSYVHTHLNYVLWYFGFIQMCFYIILDKIRTTFANKNM